MPKTTASSISHIKLKAKTKEAICYLYEVWQNSRITLYPYLALPQAPQIHESTKRVKTLFGGNRSAKTNTFAPEVAMRVRGKHYWQDVRRPPIQVWVLSADLDTSRTVQRKALLEWLPPNEIARSVWNNQERLIEHINGSQIHFKSYKQGFEQFQGRKIDIVWFDEEPQDPQIIDECEVRLLDRQGLLLISCTPLQRYTMLFYRVIQNEQDDEEVVYWHFWMEHNLYIPYAEIIRFQKKYAKDPAKLASRMHGEFALSSGTIYGNYFNPPFHVLTEEKKKEIESRRISKGWEVFRAIDPSFATYVCNWYAISPEGDVYCYREKYWHNKSISEIAFEINTHSWGEKISFTVCGAHGGDTASILELPRHGIQVIKATDYYPNLTGPEKSHVLAGISRVQEWLLGIPIEQERYVNIAKCPACFYSVRVDVRKPYCPKCSTKMETERQKPGRKKYLFFYPDCKLTLDEVQLYRWNEKQTEPVEEHCDAWSAHRYAMSTFPAPRIPEEKLPKFSIGAFLQESKINRLRKQRLYIGGN